MLDSPGRANRFRLMHCARAVYLVPRRDELGYYIKMDNTWWTDPSVMALSVEVVTIEYPTWH